MSSGPDVTRSAWPHLAPAFSLSRCQPFPGWQYMELGAPFSVTQDVPGEEPSFVVLVDSGAFPTAPVFVSRWCGGPDSGLSVLLARLGHRVLGPLRILPRFIS